MLNTDFFSFAYVPYWYEQLDTLAAMALPEPWRFKKPAHETKNQVTPILERYMHIIFRKLSIDYNSEPNSDKAQKYIHVENEFLCFHTGLFNHRYKGIYACFDRNKRLDSLLDWYFRGFCDESSPWLRYVEPLPLRPIYDNEQEGFNFYPNWPIRVNTEHIICDADNLERIPQKIRKAKNLPLLLETGVELARRKAAIQPGIVAPQGFHGRMQFLLPISLIDMNKIDLAMTLTIMDNYYMASTCLTLEMAYLNARVMARPTAPWLLNLVQKV